MTKAKKTKFLDPHRFTKISGSAPAMFKHVIKRKVYGRNIYFLFICLLTMTNIIEELVCAPHR